MNKLKVQAELSVNQKIVNKERKEKGLILKKIRKLNKLTLNELASISGLCASYISRLETGDRRYNEDIARKLANALNCSVGELLNLEKYEKSTLNSSIKKDLPIYNFSSVNEKQSDGEKKYTINFDEIAGKTFRMPEVFGSISAFGFYITENYKSFEKGDFLVVNPESYIFEDSLVVLSYLNDDVKIVRISSANENTITTSENINIDKNVLKGIYTVTQVVYNLNNILEKKKIKI